MSTYKTARGKMVSLGSIILTCAADGTLHVSVGKQYMDLTEGEASALFDLMGDVMEWESSKGITEGEMVRLETRAEDEHASGKSDDERAHDGR